MTFKGRRQRIVDNNSTMKEKEFITFWSKFDSHNLVLFGHSRQAAAMIMQIVIIRKKLKTFHKIVQKFKFLGYLYSKTFFFHCFSFI